MTVDDLRKALFGIRGDLRVEITLPDNEFPATCVTASRNLLRICQDNAEISVAETLLYDDAVEVMR